MKNVKKLMALACVLTLTTGLMAGCAKKDSDTNTSNNSGQTAKAVKLTLWDQEEQGGQKVMDEMIKEFQTKNTNITIERKHYENEDLRKNYTTASLGKTGPDIVFGPNDNLGVFVPGKLVQPLEDIMGADFFKNFDKGALEAAKFDGKQYMVPDRNGNELVLLYNKKLVSQTPKTFEELITMGSKLKTDGKVQYTLSFNMEEPFFTIPFYAAFGGKIFDNPTSSTPKPTLNTQASKDWMAYMKKLKDDAVIPKEGNYDVAFNLFKEGKVAFHINGPWAFADLQKANIDFGYMAIPSINGKMPAATSAVKGYTVSAGITDKDKKEAVKKFLEYINTKENQLRMVDAHQQLPTLTTAVSDAKVTGNPMIAGQKAVLDTCIPMSTATQMRAIWDAIKPVQQEVFAGKTKPEDAAAKMQDLAEKGIKALGL